MSVGVLIFGLIILIIMIIILNKYSQDSFQQLVDENTEKATSNLRVTTNKESTFITTK